MSKSTKSIIVFLVLLVMGYFSLYLYEKYEQLEDLTSFEKPIKLSEIKEIDPETSLNIFVREKDFLLTYNNNEETVITTEEILSEYNTLQETNPDLTVTYEAQKDLEFLRVMIPFSDLNVIPAGKMKFINKESSKKDVK